MVPTARSEDAMITRADPSQEHAPDISSPSERLRCSSPFPKRLESCRPNKKLKLKVAGANHLAAVHAVSVHEPEPACTPEVAWKSTAGILVKLRVDQQQQISFVTCHDEERGASQADQPVAEQAFRMRVSSHLFHVILELSREMCS